MSTLRVKLSPERTWMVLLLVGVRLMNPFSGKKKKNKTRKRDNIMSQGLQVYQYSCFIFIFRLETYRQVNACTSKEKWQDDTN